MRVEQRERPGITGRRPLSRRLHESIALLKLLLTYNGDKPERLYEFVGDQNRVFRETEFMNLGFWDNASSYPEAARDLARLLGDTAKLDMDDVVFDAGFGLGAQDELWLKEFGIKRIIGVNISSHQVETAKRQYDSPRLEFRLGTATKIDSSDASFTKVISLEAAYHFNTRERFLREAYRVLAPGGLLALTDIVPAEGTQERAASKVEAYVSRAMWQMPSANMYARSEYGRLLSRLGFQDLDIRSIRSSVIPGFLKAVRKQILLPAVRERVHPLLVSTWSGGNDPFADWDYILVRAAKS